MISRSETVTLSLKKNDNGIKKKGMHNMTKCYTLFRKTSQYRHAILRVSHCIVRENLERWKKARQIAILLIAYHFVYMSTSDLLVCLFFQIRYICYWTEMIVSMCGLRNGLFSPACCKTMGDNCFTTVGLVHDCGVLCNNIQNVFLLL